MLKNKHINIIRHRIALLLFIFMFFGTSHIKASNLEWFSSGLSVRHLSSQELQQEQNQEELTNFQYTNSSRDLSDLFDKTDSISAKQVDTDKVQLKNLNTSKGNIGVSHKSQRVAFIVSFKPQITQSLSLFIFNRNILI